MVNQERNVHETGRAPSKDWFLQFLVNQANKNELELDITLTVGGLLISGTLVGVRRYFDDLGEYFASCFDSGKKPEVIKETFKKIGEQCSCISPSEQTETPSYIHLKNVRFSSVENMEISAHNGTWWRGRISEVQGFSPGK